MASQLFARSAKVRILYLKHMHTRKRLSLNVVREVCSYLADPQLVQVCEGFLRFFNFQTSAWGTQVRLSSRIEAIKGSTWLALGDGRVMCSGGMQQTGLMGIGKKAYLVSEKGTVEQLPNMLYARYYHGSVQVRACIYTFGGRTLHTDNPDRNEPRSRRYVLVRSKYSLLRKGMRKD